MPTKTFSTPGYSDIWVKKVGDTMTGKLTITTANQNPSPPASLTGTFDYVGAGADIPDDGYSWTGRVYSYKIINAVKVYSLTYAQSSLITDAATSSQMYEVDWTWPAVSGVDGYLLLIQDNAFGMNYDIGVDIATNSFSLNQSTYGQFTTLPSIVTLYGTSLETNGPVTFGGNVSITGSLTTTTTATIGINLIVTGSAQLGTALAAIYGGTGYASYAVGDILYASSTTALSKLAAVATGNALISGGANTAPSWGKIALTTHVSGTLPVANGGTGIATLTANRVPYGNGTSAFQSSANFTYDGTKFSLGSGLVMVDTLTPTNPSGVSAVYVHAMTATTAIALNNLVRTTVPTIYDTYGMLNTVQTANSTGYNYGVNTGVWNESNHLGAGVVANLFGAYNRVRQYGTGDITNAIGARYIIESYGSGNIITAIGLQVTSMTKGSTGTFAIKVGLDIQDITGGTTSNHALKTGAGVVSFNDANHAEADFYVKTDNYSAIFVDTSADSIAVMNHASGKIGFFGGTPATQQTLAAYTSDGEGSAYTGIDNLQVGTVYATVADLNQLRVAYETLRASYDDLRSKLVSTTLVL